MIKKTGARPSVRLEPILVMDQQPLQVHELMMSNKAERSHHRVVARC